MKGSLRCLYYYINNIVYSRSVVFMILVLLMRSKMIESSETIRTANETVHLSNQKIKQLPKESFGTPFLSTGNNLWDNLIKDCLQKPSFQCIQKNIYAYLSDALQSSTVNISSRIQFNRNTVNYDQLTQEMDDNDIDQSEVGKKQNFILIIILKKPKKIRRHMTTPEFCIAQYLFTVKSESGYRENLIAII